MGKLPLSHRSTIYPCFVPNLGESTGAGRKGLTHGKSRKKMIAMKLKLRFVASVLIYSKKIVYPVSSFS